MVKTASVGVGDGAATCGVGEGVGVEGARVGEGVAERVGEALSDGDALGVGAAVGLGVGSAADVRVAVGTGVGVGRVACVDRGVGLGTIVEAPPPHAAATKMIVKRSVRPKTRTSIQARVVEGSSRLGSVLRRHALQVVAAQALGARARLAEPNFGG